MVGAARVSRLQIGVVPQGDGRRARHGCYLLPSAIAHGIPGPRLQQAGLWYLVHPAHHRGGLDARIPARDWREDCETRQGHPYGNE